MTTKCANCGGSGQYHPLQTLIDLKDRWEVNLSYPRIEGKKHAIEISLMDVRAADSILVSYDFDRDGWVIKQASIFHWAGDDEVCGPDWQEVAFVKAWAREKGGA